MQFPEKLHKKLQQRKEDNSFRVLPSGKKLVDFSSNDYLGFADSETIFEKTHQFLIENKLKKNGATGSRLLSGSSTLSKNLEIFLADFHNTATATIFNSGYTANLGFFGTIPQRGDIILYDELIHASIREGIRLSNAKAFKFLHNDLEDLEYRLLKQKKLRQSRKLSGQFDKKTPFEKRSQTVPKVFGTGEVYVVTESVFSMDGDATDLVKMSSICKKYNAFFVVDEAHAVGVFGEKGKGLVQELQIEKDIFARIVTFGKAMGCHGAAILGSENLKEYLINFARSFIYTTALAPHALATIQIAYELMQNEVQHQQKLAKNIVFFKEEMKRLQFQIYPYEEMSGKKWGFIPSNSAIHCCVISGNSIIKEISKQLQVKRFDVKAVLSPTVPKGKERLRFCLHAFNTKEEIKMVLGLLCKFVNS